MVPEVEVTGLRSSGRAIESSDTDTDGVLVATGS